MRALTHLLGLILLLLLEDVSEVDELLHGLHLSVQMLQIHSAGTAVGLQQQAKPLTDSLIVHLRSKGTAKCIYVQIQSCYLLLVLPIWVSACIYACAPCTFSTRGGHKRALDCCEVSCEHKEFNSGPLEESATL